MGKDKSDNPADDPKNCDTCGQPKKDHTIDQLVECAASKN